jgi:tetratricopeptide (TPR) repeat protein
MYQQSLQVFERVGDVHGMAQTWMGLGNAYKQKGEWDRAIEMYQHNLQACERLGDVYGMAQTWGNLGILYSQTNRPDQAAQYTAQAYLIFSNLGAAHEARRASRFLANLLGSEAAAIAYRVRIAQEMQQED